MNTNNSFGEATFLSLFGNLLQGNFLWRDFGKRLVSEAWSQVASPKAFPRTARLGGEDVHFFAPKNVSFPGTRRDA